MLDLIDKMVATLKDAKTDAEKFQEKGNKQAGKRVRLAMQSLKKDAQAVRIMFKEE